MKKYFITSTGTEIGKTYFMCSLISNLIKQNKSVKALKPILTGLDFSNLNECDSAKILNALGEEVNQSNILNISPFYYDTPASPDSAAIIENKAFLDYEKIKEFCQNFLDQQNKDYALIEGIGGVMVPINQNKTVIDLIKDLDIEIILVVGNYLGSRSHSLTAIDACKTRNIKIHKVIINDYNSDGEDAKAVKKSLANFCDAEIEILA